MCGSLLDEAQAIQHGSHLVAAAGQTHLVRSDDEQADNDGDEAEAVQKEGQRRADRADDEPG